MPGQPVQMAEIGDKGVHSRDAWLPFITAEAQLGIVPPSLDETTSPPPVSFTKWASARSALTRVPVQACGYSLGMLGGGGMIAIALDILKMPPVATKIVFYVAYPWATANLSLYLLHYILDFPQLIAELNSFDTCIKHGPAAIAVCLEALVLKYWFKSSDIPGSLALVVGSTLQVIQMLAFIRTCVREKQLPRADWFPSTVSIGSFAIAGLPWGVNMGWALLLPFLLAVLCTMILLPVAIYRSFRFPAHQDVCPDIRIFILQAPASFVSVIWFRMYHTAKEQNKQFVVFSKEEYLGISIFLLSLFGFFCTLYAVFQRRTAVYKQFLSDPLPWAAITFPTSSTATAVLLSLGTFYSEAIVARNPQLHALRVIILWFGMILSALAAIGIIVVNVRFSVHTFRLMFRPSGPDEVQQLRADPEQPLRHGVTQGIPAVTHTAVIPGKPEDDQSLFVARAPVYLVEGLVNGGAGPIDANRLRMIPTADGSALHSSRVIVTDMHGDHNEDEGEDEDEDEDEDEHASEAADEAPLIAPATPRSRAGSSRAASRRSSRATSVASQGDSAEGMRSRSTSLTSGPPKSTWR